MAFELSPEDRKTAEDWVAAGRFGSVEEAVHASMQKMRDEEQWSDYASDRIDAGLADIAAGRTIPGDELMAWLETFHTKPA